MFEEKFVLHNESDLDVRGTILRPKKTGKHTTLILVHDLLSGSEMHKELAKLALDAGFAVVLFDCSNSFGKSDGRPEDAMMSLWAHDIQQVSAYVKKRPYVHKTVLLGVGFGAMAAIAMEGFQAMHKACVLINCPVAIEDSVWTNYPEREMVRIKLKRYFHVIKEGKEVRLNYTLYEDGSRIDMFRCARNLRTPTLYLVSEKDMVIPAQSSERLAERTTCKKDLVALPGAGHDLGKKEWTTIFANIHSFLKRQKI